MKERLKESLRLLSPHERPDLRSAGGECDLYHGFGTNLLSCFYSVWDGSQMEKLHFFAIGGASVRIHAFQGTSIESVRARSRR